MRRVLYMTTISATRANPVTWTFYTCWVARGLPKKGRPDRHHAQVADPPQRGHARPDALADTPPQAMPALFQSR